MQKLKLKVLSIQSQEEEKRYFDQGKRIREGIPPDLGKTGETVSKHNLFVAGLYTSIAAL